jgi:hypothetical protein
VIRIEVCICGFKVATVSRISVALVVNSSAS